MSDNDGLLCAYRFDGTGHGRQVGWAEMREVSPRPGWLWVHLHREGTETRRWLRDEGGLDPLVCDALLAEETRPRSSELPGGLLVILRGVNLNPGADPEDMVALRVWLEADRVISVRRRALMAVQDLRSGISLGAGPKMPGDFLQRIADALVERMGPVIDELESGLDTIEEQMPTSEGGELRGALTALRRQAIMLRRYLAPQRDVLGRLSTHRGELLGERECLALREAADRITRYVEDLDAIRERAGVTQDELRNRLSEQMNRTMYLLSLVAAIFLPLGLITGLLGINVGGVPGTENPWAFLWVTAVLVALGAAQAVIFRRFRFF